MRRQKKSYLWLVTSLPLYLNTLKFKTKRHAKMRRQKKSYLWLVTSLPLYLNTAMTTGHKRVKKNRNVVLFRNN